MFLISRGVISICLCMAEFCNHFSTFMKFWPRVKPLLSWASMSVLSSGILTFTLNLRPSLVEDMRSFVSRLFFMSVASRVELAGSVIELSWPSGLVGSKKVSVGNFIFLLEAPSDAKAE